MLCYSLLCCVIGILYLVMSHNIVILYHVMLCYVMLCHVMLCYFMLLNIISYEMTCSLYSRESNPITRSEASPMLLCNR